MRRRPSSPSFTSPFLLPLPRSYFSYRPLSVAPPGTQQAAIATCVRPPPSPHCPFPNLKGQGWARVCDICQGLARQAGQAQSRGRGSSRRGHCHCWVLPESLRGERWAVVTMPMTGVDFWTSPSCFTTTSREPRASGFSLSYVVAGLGWSPPPVQPYID